MSLPAFTPRQWFLLDAGGALLSAFLIGVVGVRYQAYVGLPVPTLYLLSAIPLGYVVVDLVASLVATDRPAPYLRLVAILNVLYCLLSLALAVRHYAVLTLLGKTYLLGEIAVVLFLARLEWRAAGRFAEDRPPAPQL